MLRVVVSLAAGFAALTPVSARAGHASLALVVKVYNSAGFDAGEMIRAREMTRSIFGRVGIDAVWRDCEAIARINPSSTVCAHPQRPEEIVVRIVRSPAGWTGTNVLGFSSVVVAASSSSLATVLADRVGLVAARTQSASGKLLGRVIAHEMGHLLLATNRHGGSGLMRADWHDDEISGDRPMDWVFLGVEARQLRLAVAARSKGADEQPIAPARATWEAAASTISSDIMTAPERGDADGHHDQSVPLARIRRGDRQHP